MKMKILRSGQLNQIRCKLAVLAEPQPCCWYVHYSFVSWHCTILFVCATVPLVGRLGGEGRRSFAGAGVLVERGQIQRDSSSPANDRLACGTQYYIAGTVLGAPLVFQLKLTDCSVTNYVPNTM